MWKAIVIRTGNIIQFNHCLIDDGREGVRFEQGYNAATSFIHNCRFSSNLAGITANNVPTFTFALFSGNQFLGDAANALPPFTPGTPQALVGINVSNTTGTLGHKTTPNFFRNLSVGIRLTSNSDLAVNNCRFEDNLLAPTGRGIDMDNSNITMEGTFNGGRSCVFIHNNTDIQSTNTRRLHVRNALFRNPVNNSILVNQSNNPANIRVRYCGFAITSDSPLPTGNLIDIQRSNQSGSVRNTILSYDTIVVDHANSGSSNNTRLINLQPGTNTGLQDVAYIGDNIIISNYGNPNDNSPTRTIDAIVLDGLGDNYQVYYNNIDYSAPLEMPNGVVISIAVGILNNPGTGNQIVRTNGKGRYFPTHTPQNARAFLRCGVHTQNTPTVFLCYNTMDNTTNNFHFNDDCSNIELSANTMGTGEFGLVSDNMNSLPTNHHHRRNKWIGTYNPFSSRYSNAPIGLLWNVNPAVDPTFMPPQPTNPVVWFNSNTDAPPPLPCNNLPESDDPEVRKVVEQLVAGIYAFTNAANLKDFEYNLMYQLFRFPANMVASMATEQYFDNRKNSSLGQLAQALWKLGKAAVISPGYQAQIDSYYETTTLLHQQIAAIEELPDAVDDLVLQEQKIALLMQISQKNTDFETLIGLIRQEQLPKFQDALAFINTIEASDDWEIGRKQYLLFLAHSNLGMAPGIQQIRDLAHGCEEALGATVSMARAHLPASESNAFGLCTSETHTDCGEQRSPKNTVETDGQLAVILAPNPAKDIAVLTFNQPFTGTVMLIDQSGTVRLANNFVDTSTAILPVSGLPSGTYIVQCQGNGPKIAKRITIIH